MAHAKYTHTRRSRAALLLVALIVAVVCGASWFSYRGGVEALESEAAAQMDWEAASASASSAKALDDAVLSLELWAHQSLMLRILDQDPDGEIAVLLRTGLKRLPGMRDLTCVAIDGTVVASTDALFTAAKAALTPERVQEFLDGARATLTVEDEVLLLCVPVIWRFDQNELIGVLHARLEPEALIVDERPTLSVLSAESVGVLVRRLGHVREQSDTALQECVVRDADVTLPERVLGPRLTLTVAEPTHHMYAQIGVLRSMSTWMTVGTALAVLLIVLVFLRGERSLMGQLEQRALELETINSDLAASRVALQQASERADASNRAKGEFLANMSHEIRTPMNGVIGVTDLMLDGALTLEQRDYAETIKKSGQALLTIIDDILDFSKIEAGKLVLESIEFDLASEVEAAIEVVGERAAGKQIELACMLADDLPLTVRGDPTRLRQILLNLLSNAVKFTERGCVVLRARVLECTTHDTLVRFDVTDSGIGIPADAIGKLFRSFAQADGSTTRKYGGTGLGLVISRELARRMGGEMGVESEFGRGSTFHFTVRLGSCAAPAAALPSASTNLAALSVLCVDDNATAREVFGHQLRDRVRAFASVDNAASALESLRAACAAGNPFDVALVDLYMPGMSGEELVRAIRAEPALASITIVLVSARRERVEDDVRREARAVLTKPVRRAHLLRAIDVTSEAPSAPSKNPAESAARKFDLRCLLAEDNTVNQKVASRMLELMGCSVHVVDNGRQALDALAKESFDIIFMDCQMPELDGYEATRELRALERGTTRHALVIAMTAHAMQGDREKCIASGMDDYVTKPIRTEALRQVLEHWARQPAE